MNITELCVNCKQNSSCTMCWKTSNKKCPHFIQKTNADRIRAMSDEELAKYLVLVENRRRADGGGAIWCFFEDALEWLKQPADQ